MRPSRHSFSRQFSHRSKSSSTVIPCPLSNFVADYPNARKVQIRLVFIHIGKTRFLIRWNSRFFSLLGEIDTLNEKYQADIYFEARWIEKRMSLSPLGLTSQQQTQFHENLIVKINELNSTIYWSPQLFIENAISQIGQQEKWFTIKKIDSDLSQSLSLNANVEICEHRRMKGIFWEKLELNHVSID